MADLNPSVILTHLLFILSRFSPFQQTPCYLLHFCMWLAGFYAVFIYPSPIPFMLHRILKLFPLFKSLIGRPSYSLCSSSLISGQLFFSFSLRSPLPSSCLFPSSNVPTYRKCCNEEATLLSEGIRPASRLRNS